MVLKIKVIYGWQGMNLESPGANKELSGQAELFDSNLIE